MHKDQNIGVRIMVMQTHFDNANGVPNQIDQSGIDVYVTENLRQYDAGFVFILFFARIILARLCFALL